MRTTIYLLIFANLMVAAWLYWNGEAFDERLFYSPVQVQPGQESLQLVSEQAAVAPPDQMATETALPESVDAEPVEPLAVPPAADVATQAPGSDPVAGPAQAQTICQAIGPYAEAGLARALADRISAAGARASLREESVDQPSGYWVYLSAMPHEQAQRIVAEFQSKGVKDYFLGRQNFISLGVFSDKRSADARVKSISAMGYTPRVEPRFLKRSAYWVDVVAPVEPHLNSEAWESLLAADAGIDRHVITCK